MNEEQEGGRLLILILLAYKSSEEGISILILFSHFYADLNRIFHIGYWVVPYMDSTEHNILLIIQLTNEINIHIIEPTLIFHEVGSSSLESTQLLTQLIITSDLSLEIYNYFKHVCHVYSLFTDISYV